MLACLPCVCLFVCFFVGLFVWMVCLLGRSFFCCSLVDDLSSCFFLGVCFFVLLVFVFVCLCVVLFDVFVCFVCFVVFALWPSPLVAAWLRR